jgi:type I restriction enzyme, S subunit
MSLENTRYLELTFINDLDEIKKQIRNTILFLFLAEKYGVSILSDYLEGTQYGYTASAKAEGDTKLLRITDITEGKVNWETVPFCDCNKPTNYLLKQDDILVARTGGTTGKSFIVKDVPSNVVYASYLIRLRIKNENNPEFISAYLNSYTYWSQLVELKRGAAQPNVNAEKLKKIVIPKCSPDVQNIYVSYLNGDFNEDVLDSRINEILSLFDYNHSLKAEQTQQLDLLKKLRQQILQDAVQGKLVPQDPNDEPASMLLERIKAEKEQLIKEKKIKKDKPLPEIKPEEIPFEIPKGWGWCRLGEITNYGSSPKAEPSDITKETWVLDLEDIEKETSKLLCKERFSERQSLSTKSVFKQGDILYSKLRPYLDKVIVADEDGVCTTEILPLHCFSNLFPFYLRLVLKRKDFLLYVNSVTKGMKMPRLGTSEGKSALIPLCPVGEQHRIVAKIEQLMKLCDELEQSIKQNQKYTQDLLQVALKEALEPKK